MLGYRLVKTYFNRIFPVSSLSFFLPCLVIFALNYVSVSFDISIKKWGFWNKTDPSYGNVWIRLWDTCKICTLSYSVVCRQFVKAVQQSLVDCVKFSVLVNKCVRPSCSLGGSTYPKKTNNKKQQNKARDSPYKYHFCSMRLGFVVSRYLLGTLGDSHYFL